MDGEAGRSNVVRGRYVCLVTCLAMFLLLLTFEGSANDEEEAPEICASDLRGEYLGQSTPGSDPVRFAPSPLRATSRVWWVSAPVFSADGGLVVWTRYHVGDRDPDYKDVVFAEQGEDGCWTQPEAVSANGGHDDAHAAFVPGTNELLLISDRPGGPLFRIERTSGDWTEPLSVPISVPYRMGHQITISETGTLYFRMTDDGNMDLYRSGLVDGRYEPRRAWATRSTPQARSTVRGSVLTRRFFFLRRIDPVGMAGRIST